MEELKSLVAELRNKENKNEIVSILQKIGKKLITEYEISVAGITIVPLWLEAYYFDQNKFADCNMHLDDKQKDRFGQLYFHTTGYGGFDICLSNSKDFYLSFLLKATLIDGKFNTQTGVYDVLAALDKKESDLEEEKNILIKRKQSTDYDVQFVQRVGLTKPCFVDEELAIFPIEELSNDNYNFTFAHKVLLPLVKTKIKEYKLNHADCTKQECEAECRKIFGWAPENLMDLLKD